MFMRSIKMYLIKLITNLGRDWDCLCLKQLPTNSNGCSETVMRTQVRALHGTRASPWAGRSPSTIPRPQVADTQVLPLPTPWRSLWTNKLRQYIDDVNEDTTRKDLRRFENLTSNARNPVSTASELWESSRGSLLAASFLALM
ncbi:hypothetical protein J6590_087717 [Homalodisca vitripennis]|nr:hypothetical protein J6590_087717 [Homalodisca vitripennis]